MPRRYDELVAILHASGFDIAWNTHPAYPNEWRGDPPAGLVRVKGVWLPNADEDPDADEDPRVTFSMTEHWSEARSDHAFLQREGLWLVGYGYNGSIAGEPADQGRRNHRHDYDQLKSSQLVYHVHPFGQINDIRHAEAPHSPESAITDFLAVLGSEIAAGRFAAHG